MQNPPLRVVPPEEELWLACGRGDADAALRLLYGRGGPPDERASGMYDDVDGGPPLSPATAVDRQCDPTTTFPISFTSPVGGATVLHQAAYRGMTAVALRLVELGIDPRTLDALGKSAKSVALEMGHLGLAAKLEAIGLARDAAGAGDAFVVKRGGGGSIAGDEAPSVLGEG